MISKKEDFYVVSDHGIRTVENIYKIKETDDLPFTKQVNGLQKFIHKADHIKTNSFDQTITGRSVSVRANDRGIQLEMNGTPFHLTSWSLNQLSAAMHIPSRYAQEMVKHKKYELFNDNFSSWITSHGLDKVFQMRTYGNTVRGILSTDFVPVDVDFLLPLLQSGLSNSSMSFKIDRGTINPEFTNIRIISNHQIDVGGDPHFVGFRFATSDVGQSVVKFEYFIFRSMCSNGMFFGRKGGELFKKKHTTKDMVNQYYVENLIGGAFQNLDELVSSTSTALNKARDIKVTDEDVEKIMERFLSRTTFGKRRTEQLFGNVAVLAKHQYEGDNLFSIANAITELAQGFDIKSQEEAESFAGDLLFMKL